MKVERQVNSKTMLVKVYSSLEEIMTSDYAIIPITEKLINHVKFLRDKVMAIKKEAKEQGFTDVINIRSWYIGEVNFLSQEEGEEKICSDEIIEAIEKTGIQDTECEFINDDFIEVNNDELAFVRDDGVYISVDDYAFRFSTTIKHTDTELRTSRIEFEKIGVRKTRKENA
jgi:hypothetical protein